MHDFLQSNNYWTLLIKCESNYIIVKQNILYVNIYIYMLDIQWIIYKSFCGGRKIIKLMKKREK